MDVEYARRLTCKRQAETDLGLPTPKAARRSNYSSTDRYIPLRDGRMLHLPFSTASAADARKAAAASSAAAASAAAAAAAATQPQVQTPPPQDEEAATQEREGQQMYDMLLRAELTPGAEENLLRFSPARAAATEGPLSPFALSPVSARAKELLLAPRKPLRKIPKVPFKVLDAPELQDDFYLNLVDWSSNNTLCVGLGSCVYLWSACTSQVTKLCDLRADRDQVASVQWAQRGSQLAIGTSRGKVLLWDSQHCKLVRSFSGHTARRHAGLERRPADLGQPRPHHPPARHSRT